jgi:hypothetical protein
MSSVLHRKLGEGLPERRPPTKDSFQTEPRALKMWIEALPLANASATARLLFQALREINGLRIDPALRVAALEALRRPVAQIAEAIDRQIIGSSFPLPPQKQQLGSVAQDFQRELALGFRMAAYELCLPDGKVGFLRGKQVTHALERAIAHLGAQLCKAYLVYATPPEGLWATLHDLYRFAASVNLEDKPIEDPLLGGAEMAPRSSYLHALLFAVSNPYRLGQKEIHDGYQVTRIWAPQCELVAGHGGERAYAIPVEEDKGPGYLPEERRSEAGVLSFDTSALERDLKRQLAAVEGVGGPISFRMKGAPAVTIPVDLVRRLMYSWEPVAQRSHARLPAGHRLDSLIGLTAIHYHLASRTDFESFMRRVRGPGITLSDRERAATWTHGGESAPEVFSALVLDQSLGGYRIEWDKAESVKARVGEIVGFAAPVDEPDDADWMVGIIRWLRISPDGRVDAGVELLAREARAAALRALDGEGRPKPPVRAIRMEPLRKPGQPGQEPSTVTLLAPSVLERTAPRFELTTAAHRYADTEDAEVHHVEGLQLLEQTANYVRLVPSQPDQLAAETPDALGLAAVGG